MRFWIIRAFEIYFDCRLKKKKKCRILPDFLDFDHQLEKNVDGGIYDEQSLWSTMRDQIFEIDRKKRKTRSMIIFTHLSSSSTVKQIENENTTIVVDWWFILMPDLLRYQSLKASFTILKKTLSDKIDTDLLPLLSSTFFFTCQMCEQ